MKTRLWEHRRDGAKATFGNSAMDEECVPHVLDRISADWALAWALRGGNDLLAHYTGFRGRSEAHPAFLRRNTGEVPP